MIVSVKSQADGEEAEEQPKDDEQLDEDGIQIAKPQNSDESEEEEIKVPQRDLTGKYNFA